MNFHYARDIQELVRRVEQGEEVPPDLLKRARKTIDRELKILEERSERSRQNIERWKMREY